MFVETTSSALRTPAGCNVPPSLKVSQSERLTLHPAGVRSRKGHLYKHRTPLGRRNLRDRDLAL